MSKEQLEFQEAMSNFLSKINKSISISLEARDKLTRLVHESNLKSMLTMLREDIDLKKMLNQVRY